MIPEDISMILRGLFVPSATFVGTLGEVWKKMRQSRQ